MMTEARVRVSDDDEPLQSNPCKVTSIVSGSADSVTALSSSMASRNVSVVAADDKRRLLPAQHPLLPARHPRRSIQLEGEQQDPCIDSILVSRLSIALRLMAGAEDLNVTALNKHVGPRVVDPLYGLYGNEE